MVIAMSLKNYSAHYNQQIDTPKQVVGIDVDKTNLVVCLGRIDPTAQPELYAAKTFANTQKGFKALVGWVNGRSNELAPLYYVMEATGVYHESLAY